jgi:serine/threonine protein kinase
MNLFGVVHRDLHQGNVLVDTYNVPRIIDFNLSVSVRSSTKVGVSDLSHKHDIGITQEPPDSTLVNAIVHGENPMTVIQDVCFKKPVLSKVSALLGFSKRDMYDSLVRFYKKSKSMRSGDMEKWFSLYYRVIDSWAIGVMLVELIHKLSLWPAFAGTIRGVVRELIPVLRNMCAVSPMERIDCVQALHLLDPGHIVLRRYGAKWLEIVGTAK